ncbi:MAG: NAD(P)-binding domain-containing protein [Streptosporangiaceae bacterium]
MAAPLLLAGAAQPGLGESPAVLKFPASWPAYLSKDELADWLEAYASIMSLDVWTSTEITGAGYDEPAGRWAVTLRRAGGIVTELHPRHVVLATGVFGIPHRPAIPGAAHFTGRLLHATEYTGGVPAAGLRALVVGSGSSAHDVAQDLSRRAPRSPCSSGRRPAWSAWNPGRPGRTPSTARMARPPRTVTWSTTPSRCPCWPTCIRTCPTGSRRWTTCCCAACGPPGSNSTSARTAAAS